MHQPFLVTRVYFIPCRNIRFRRLLPQYFRVWTKKCNFKTPQNFHISTFLLKMGKRRKCTLDYPCLISRVVTMIGKWKICIIFKIENAVQRGVCHLNRAVMWCFIPRGELERFILRVTKEARVLSILLTHLRFYPSRYPTSPD